MAKVGVIFAQGFEEIEALTPVDVLRRAGIECDMIGLTDQTVTGSHAIPVLMDKAFDGSLSDYDMIVLPGGLPGAHHLRDHEGLIAALQKKQQLENILLPSVQPLLFWIGPDCWKEKTIPASRDRSLISSRGNIRQT